MIATTFIRAHLFTKQTLNLIIGIVFVVFLVFFIRHESVEIAHVKEILTSAKVSYIVLGIILSLLFILVQGNMYRLSFKSIDVKTSFSSCVILYLKRFSLGVFLPGGGVTNLLFYNKDLEKEGVSSVQVVKASSIFTVCSNLTSLVVLIPGLIYFLITFGFKGGSGKYIFLLGAAAVLALIILVLALRRFTRHKSLSERFPGLAKQLAIIREGKVDKRFVFQVVLSSVIIEVICILLIVVSFAALGKTVPIFVACFIYAVVLGGMIISPLLKGAGVIELAMTYSLNLLGYDVVDALSIAVLFRFFEFWIFLALGLLAMLIKRDQLFTRLGPPILLLILGFVNILSGLTPILNERFELLQNVIPIELIHGSAYLSVILGLFAIATAIYLLKGLKSAWYAALVICLTSILVHLSKGIDWEEALLAIVVLIPLLINRRKFYGVPVLVTYKRMRLIIVSLVLSVLLLMTACYYLIDFQHFGVNLNIGESFNNAVKSFFLINTDLRPQTDFAREYLVGVKVLSVTTLATILILMLLQLVKPRELAKTEDKERAMKYVGEFGDSSLDYFKTYKDKQFYFSTLIPGFLSYKVSGAYAVVLENPVAQSQETRSALLGEFEKNLRTEGLTPIYYRISEDDVEFYRSLGRKLLPIGEEATVNFENFTLQGKDGQNFRSAINKLTKTGYTFEMTSAPQKDDFIQQLKHVSNEWLAETDRSEITFSQGVFDEEEIKGQTIFSIQNTEGKVFAFINMIPGFPASEANFDLMRKTVDSPHGTMDALFGSLITQLREAGFKSLNLGMVPMSGIDKPNSTLESAIKLAYEKIKALSHYKSLRSYKEKFHPEWKMMYLVYESDYDLIMFPSIFKKIIQV